MYIQKFGTQRHQPPVTHSDVGHFTTLRTHMRDAERLKAALQALEIPVLMQAEVRGSHTLRCQADIVAILEGQVDIGYIRAEDGSFNLVVNLWGLAQRCDQTALIHGIYQQYLALNDQSEGSD